MKSIIQLDIGLSPEYKEWIEDLIKFFTFSVVAHFLANASQGTSGQIFTWTWLKSALFLLIGLSFYHLVVKKLFTLVYNDDVGDGYIPTVKLYSKD